jgi:DNA repair protein RecN (Recombination protein N)
MPSAIFEIKITQLRDNDSFVHLDEQQVKIHSKGFDQVEFFLSANPGEEVKPLTEIASGGEISRIMLAIKSVFNKIDPVDTLVFDEIDTGISGVTAEKVSESLKNISTNKQVMCISHLPQIARAADNHLHVSKTIVDDTTIISVNYLDKKDQNSVIDYLAGTRKYLDLNFQKSKSAFSVLNG